MSLAIRTHAPTSASAGLCPHPCYQPSPKLKRACPSGHCCRLGFRDVHKCYKRFSPTIQVTLWTGKGPLLAAHRAGELPRFAHLLKGRPKFPDEPFVQRSGKYRQA